MSIIDVWSDTLSLQNKLWTHLHGFRAEVNGHSRHIRIYHNEGCIKCHVILQQCSPTWTNWLVISHIGRALITFCMKCICTILQLQLLHSTELIFLALILTAWWFIIMKLWTINLVIDSCGWEVLVMVLCDRVLYRISTLYNHCSHFFIMH